jgi:diguanylate cyclase (GGDEF)-like protein/PAS domain S-box-containing protein
MLKLLSIKTRITLLMVGLFGVGTCALIYAVSARLERELIEVVSAQQFAAASYIAADIDASLKFRLNLLSNAAQRLTPELVSRPERAAEFLRQRDALNELFKVGLVLISKEGKGIADYPYIPERRSSGEFRELSYFKEIMATGEGAIGTPGIGRVTKIPVIGMGVPVKNRNSEIVAILVGYTNLSDAMLFGQVEHMTIGRAGYVAIDDSKNRLIVASSDPKRIHRLEPIPAPGVNLLLDRFIAGYEGSGVTINSRQLKVLSSAKRIPTSNWIVQIVIPTNEAFAPVSNMKLITFSSNLFIIILMALLTRLIVRRAFRPIDHAITALEGIADHSTPIPPTDFNASNEVGALLTSLNKLVTGRNVSEQATRKMAMVFSNSNEAILITDAENKIVAVNPAFTNLTGYAEEDVIGQNPKLLSAGKTPIKLYQEMWSAIETTGHWQGELWDRRKTGEPYPKWLSISAVRDTAGDVEHYIGSFIDISERKASEERIRHLAYHDALTGLPNRFSLREKLGQAITFSRRSQQQLALMLIDLDHFKIVNDTLGHPIGDQLLVMVAERISAAVRDSDIVARLGGDEFVVVLTALTTTADVGGVAEKIVRDVSRPYSIDGQELVTGPSIGICIFPDNGTEIEDLLRDADMAMYHAKSQGRGNYQFFAEDMNLRIHERQALEKDLRAALKEDQFELHYQPQLDLRTGQLCGVEALVRWRHPIRGMVPPMDFIPLAEEVGLIGPLGEWIMSKACWQLAQWRMKGLTHIRMSVNLSSRQFKDSRLAERIYSTMHAVDLPPEMLDLEITESMSMEAPADAIALMRRLTAQGLSLSIDDFGTGYSSLAYLKLFPISTLKIDRSFVKDIETDKNDADICDVIVQLAHKLGLDVLAEGVETPDQLKFLFSIGCEKVQGYLISKPLPAAEAEAFIRRPPELRY